MKRILLFLGVVVLVTGLVPGVHGVADGQVVGQLSGKVTFVHDATYGVPPGTSTSSFAGTLCLEGQVVDANFAFGDILAPQTLTARPYTVDFYTATNATCTLGGGDVTAQFGVANGVDLTVGLIWTSTGTKFAEWTNNPACVPADTARVTVRHGADTQTAVDVIGTINGNTVTLLSNIAEGAQASIEGPAGVPVQNVTVVRTGTTVPLIQLGTVTLTAGTNLVVYAGGGADGPRGAFTDVIQVGVCTPPTTPTQPTTPPPSPAAQPATAAPKFTG